jgi:hypothetical protein
MSLMLHWRSAAALTEARWQASPPGRMALAAQSSPTTLRRVSSQQARVSAACSAKRRGVRSKRTRPIRIAARTRNYACQRGCVVRAPSPKREPFFSRRYSGMPRRFVTIYHGSAAGTGELVTAPTCAADKPASTLDNHGRFQHSLYPSIRGGSVKALWQRRAGLRGPVRRSGGSRVATQSHLPKS